MAQRLFDLLARLQEDVLANAVAQPIDLDPASPQNEMIQLKMNSFRHRTWTWT
jgi:hypothetical protein